MDVIEAEHEEIVLTGEKTYYGVNCNTNTRKQSVTLERLQEELKIAQDYNEALGKDYKELEKENAELKGEADSVLDNWCRGDDPCPHLKKRDDQLTKAKELIENIIRVTWGEGWNYSLDWKVKAEAFLNKE